MTGSIDSEDLINRQYCSVNDVVIFGLEYRLAPEHKVVPTLMSDAEDGLKWTYQNASMYGADVSQGLIVSGTSVGTRDFLFVIHFLTSPIRRSSRSHDGIPCPELTHTRPGCHFPTACLHLW